MSYNSFGTNFGIGFLNGMMGNNPFYTGCLFTNNFFFNPFNSNLFTNSFSFNPFNSNCLFNNNFYFNPFNNISLFTVQNPIYNYSTNLYPMPSFPQPALNTSLLSQEFQTPTYLTQQNFQNYSTREASQTSTIKKVEKDLPSIQMSKKVEKDLPSVQMSKNAKELKARWKSKRSSLSNHFYHKVIKIAHKVKCSPDDLMALMYSESGLNSKIQNSIGAVGLIQFMPATAKDLGTTTTELKSMSAEKQLNYVEKYLLKQKKAAGYRDSESIDAGTLYALTFLPAFSKREVLSTRNDKYYKPNSGLDRNKDGKITKTDLSNRLKGYYA